MAPTIESRCARCGDHDVRLDEHGACESCYWDLEGIAYVLDDVDELVKGWLERKLPPEWLRAAIGMSLANAEGPLLETPFTREAVETFERGLWRASSSAFRRPSDQREPNQIRHLRTCSGLTLEALAEGLNVDAKDLALWECGVLPVDEHVASMCALFGVSAAHLLGLEDEVA